MIDYTKEFKLAKRNYIDAKRNNDSILETEKKIKNQVLKENQFFVSDEWDNAGERILDCNDDYDMSENDFDRYFDAIHKMRVNLGYGKYYANKDLSFDCHTRKKLIIAKKDLINAGVNYIKFVSIKPELANELDNAKKYMDLENKLIKKFLEFHL